MLVRDWMTTHVHTATPDSSVSDVMYQMRERKITHVPVVQDEALVGIISDRDIKQYIPSKGTSLDVYELNYLLAKSKARDVMKKPVVTAAPETPVEEAAMLLHDRKIGCLPVVDNGKLVGIISDQDLYRVLIEISGVRSGGHRVSLLIEDRAGSIKDVADVLRKHGFRLQSIMSSSEKAPAGYRYIVIRTRGDGDFTAMKSELAGYNYPLLHIV